jgi:hypothetical protein
MHFGDAKGFDLGVFYSAVTTFTGKYCSKLQNDIDERSWTVGFCLYPKLHEYEEALLNFVQGLKCDDIEF